MALEPVRKKLDVEIGKLAATLPEYLFTLPGVTELTIVSLYGEVDPIETFKRPSQLTIFVGLDPKVFQSGHYDAPRRHVSKRGCPYKILVNTKKLLEVCLTQNLVCRSSNPKRSLVTPTWTCETHKITPGIPLVEDREGLEYRIEPKTTIYQASILRI